MNPLRPEHEGPWLERVRAELDASARDLDAATLSRLNRARQAALAAARGRRARLWRYGGPAALAAAFSLLVAIGWWGLRAPASAPDAATDFELLAGEDSPELYEDLEFYAWLDAQPSSEG
jgi:hypothetical protein